MTLQSRMTPSVRAADYGRNHDHAQAPEFAYGKNSMSEDSMLSEMETALNRKSYTPHKSSQPVYNAVMDIMKDGRERTIGDLLTGVKARGLDIERRSMEFMVKCIVGNGDFVQEKLPERMFCYRARHDLLTDL